MKAFLFLVCVCVVTNGIPIEDFDITSEGPGTTTDSGATSTVTPVTVGPGSSQSTALPVSFVTVSPGSETSESPFSGETTMSSKGTTQPPPATVSQHSMHSIKTPSTTHPPSTAAPQKGGGFDGGSFAGGIALGAGIALILYVAYRIYASKKTSGYSTM